ncbi:hypothetical protein [Geothrix terrae]|uniref:hypothetical protein n=1 Tax=Geothrix terrae TaxID=2922720 RepID=UPI001FAE2AAA|nr:hypothetical protein [Geothrix terrae]
MRALSLPSMLLILVSVGCTPPYLIPYNPSDPIAVQSMAREEIRTLPLSPDVAFGSLTEALLNMKCRITASDSANGLLSFEQKTTYRFQGNPWISTKEGTLHITKQGTSVQVHLFLRGHPTTARDSQLAPEEYRRFLDELQAALK